MAVHVEVSSGSSQIREPSPCTPRQRIRVQQCIKRELEGRMPDTDQDRFASLAKYFLNAMSDSEVIRILHDPDKNPRVSGGEIVQEFLDKVRSDVEDHVRCQLDEEPTCGRLSVKASEMASEYGIDRTTAALVVLSSVSPSARQSELELHVMSRLRTATLLVGPILKSQATTLVQWLSDGDILLILRSEEPGVAAIANLATRADIRSKVVNAVQSALAAVYSEARSMAQKFVASLSDVDVALLASTDTAASAAAACLGTRLLSLVRAPPKFAEQIFFFLDPLSVLRAYVALGPHCLLPVPPCLRHVHVASNKRSQPCVAGSAIAEIPHRLSREWYKFPPFPFDSSQNREEIELSAKPWMSFDCLHGVCFRVRGKLTPSTTKFILADLWRRPASGPDFGTWHALLVTYEVFCLQKPPGSIIVLRKNDDGSWPSLQELPEQVEETGAVALLITGYSPWPSELTEGGFIPHVPILQLSKELLHHYISGPTSNAIDDPVDRYERTGIQVTLCTWGHTTLVDPVITVRTQRNGQLHVCGHELAPAVRIHSFNIRGAEKLNIKFRRNFLEHFHVELTPCCDWEVR